MMATGAVGKRRRDNLVPSSSSALGMRVNANDN